MIFNFRFLYVFQILLFLNFFFNNVFLEESFLIGFFSLLISILFVFHIRESRYIFVVDILKNLKKNFKFLIKIMGFYRKIFFKIFKYLSVLKKIILKTYCKKKKFFYNLKKKIEKFEINFYNHFLEKFLINFLINFVCI